MVRCGCDRGGAAGEVSGVGAGADGADAPRLGGDRGWGAGPWRPGAGGPGDRLVASAIRRGVTELAADDACAWRIANSSAFRLCLANPESSLVNEDPDSGWGRRLAIRRAGLDRTPTPRSACDRARDNIAGDTTPVVIPFGSLSIAVLPVPGCLCSWRCPVADSAPRRRRRARRSSPPVLERINPNAAGIDCGATTHVVAVPPDRDDAPVQSFRTCTTDVHRLADGLVACRVTTVALESTGVFWIPIDEILETRGLTVHLVNARHVRNLPGRTSDVSDAESLRDLHSVGLLRGSFRPTAAIVTLRPYLRHRHTLVELAATQVQRMQKALVQMNLQLPFVISDITGRTGLQIIRAIVAGEHDPAQLATFRVRRCRATPAEIAAALTGHYRPELLFALQQNLERDDACERHW